MPGELLLTSLIDTELWNDAGWEGTAFIHDPSGARVPAIGIVLANRDAAKKIFQAWRTRLGSRDKDEILRVSIVEGNDGSHEGYWVTLGTDLDALERQAKANGHEFKFDNVLTLSRVHRMSPAPGSPHLPTFKREFEKHEQFDIIPVYGNRDTGKTDMDFSLAIRKTRVLIRNKAVLRSGDPDYHLVS